MHLLRSTFISIFRHAALLPLALAGLFSATSAHAQTPICVSTPALLRNALQTASLVDLPFEIRIVGGQYLFDAPLNYTIRQPLTLRGGYNADCSLPGFVPNVVIDMGGGGHAINLFQPSGSPQAKLAIENIIFYNSTMAIGLSAGNSADSEEGSVVIKNTIFRDVSSYRALYVNAFGGIVSMENVELSNLHSTGANGEDFRCAVLIEPSGGEGSAVLNHVTSYLSDDDVCFSGYDSANYFIYNSIFWHAPGKTSRLRVTYDDPVHTEIHNTTFTDLVSESGATIVGQLTSDPKFVDTFASDYRLTTSPPSSAINSGTSFVLYGSEPQFDIEGNPRVIGTQPDRGAHESALDDRDSFIVTNTASSGPGSLFQAITEANINPAVAKTIRFDIRNGANVPLCPAVIALTASLPNVAAPLFIDGYSQPGSLPNTHEDAFNATLCIALTKAPGASVPAGLRVAQDAPIAASLKVRGLGFGGFGQSVQLLGGSDHQIAGNQFGGTLGATALAGASLNAVTFGVNASGSLIVGGQNVADRNVIVGAATSGVFVQSVVDSTAAQCQIVNNSIGIAPNGSTLVPNAYGVQIAGNGCSVTRNRIAGNTIANIFLNGGSDSGSASNGSNNVVQKNLIGFTAFNQWASDDETGILVTGSHNVIGASGDTGLSTANTIRKMREGAVVVRGPNAVGNRINANYLYDNGAGDRGLDIDLQPAGGAAGPTPNDAGDADMGGNALQNFPVPTGLVYSAPGTVDRPATLSATLATTPGTYRIDVYYAADATPGAASGHAAAWLGRATVVVGASGQAGFTVPVVVPMHTQTSVLSMTASSIANGTSEIGTPLSTAGSAVAAASVFRDDFE